jgi:hypothetical protein
MNGKTNHHLDKFETKVLGFRVKKYTWEIPLLHELGEIRILVF